jgi:hypothetical protein
MIYMVYEVSIHGGHSMCSLSVEYCAMHAYGVTCDPANLHMLVPSHRYVALYAIGNVIFLFLFFFIS